MVISTRNRAVMHVPNFATNLKLVHYDGMGDNEMKCFLSVSLSDHHRKDGTVIVLFYNKSDAVMFQLKTEIPNDWSMHDYLKVMHVCIVLNNNTLVVHSSKINGKSELGEIRVMIDYFRFDSEKLNRIL